MVNAAKADIISPAVAAKDPYGLLGKELFIFENIQSVLAVTIEFFKLSDHSVSSGGVLLAVFLSCHKVCDRSLYAFRCFFACSDLFQLCDQSFTDRLLTEIHTKAMLCVIFKQRVSPCRTVTVLVDCVRTGCSRTAPDGRTSCCVGDIHSVAEELSDQTSIGCFCTSCAGA